MTHYTREDLIRFCGYSVRPAKEYRNRDDPYYQNEFAQCWLLLMAGWEYVIGEQDGCWLSISITHHTFESLDEEDVPMAQSDFLLATSPYFGTAHTS